MPGLFTPLKVGSVELRNRVVLPPMATEKSTEDGFPTEELYEHYEKQSKGPGLVIVEHSYVSRKGKLSSNQLGIYSDEHVKKLSKLSDVIKSKGAVSAIQINHAGGACKQEVTGEKVVAPSDSYFKEDVEPLTIEEMETIKDDFVQAAKRAVKAGFDAVEVHGAHGFLLGQFLSPLTNQRDDEYGGEKLDDRMRFPLEVVENVKEVVGDALLLYRLGATDMDENGLTVEESKIFAEELEKRGLDIIDVSGNLSGSRLDKDEQGFFVPIAEEIKSVVNVPVIGVGGITEASYADGIVHDEKVDLVAVGRQQWKNPDWVDDAKKELT
ncbi:MAG: NADH:flavin oxidoreductase [Candidatus Saliniplasma sp.]